jgi:hypothetical protein
MRRRALILTVFLASTCLQSCTGVLSASRGTPAGGGPLAGSPFVLPNLPGFGTPFIQTTNILSPGNFIGGGTGGPP